MLEEIPIYTPFISAGLGAALGGATAFSYNQPTAFDLLRGMMIGGGIGATTALLSLAGDYILTKMLGRRSHTATPFIYGVPMVIGSWLTTSLA